MLYIITLSSLIFSNLATNCCIDAPDENTCGDVATSPCMWIENDAAAMAKSQGIACVSESWYQCEVVGNCPPPPPVPPVPKACIFDACANTNDVLNIAFVVDESGSVGAKDYYTSLDFIKKMIENDINDISPVSILAFASYMDRVYSFNEYHNGGNFGSGKHGALAALAAETFTSGGTNTGGALQDAAAEFAAQTQPNENNILILMTDGYPNSASAVCAQKPALDAAGVEVYIVGITSGFSKTAVQCVVNDPKDDYIISIPKFTDALFYHIEAQLRRVVCPAAVFQHGFTKFYVSDATIINGVTSNNLLYIIGLVLLICGGLVYYFRERLCVKNEKYVPLINEKAGQYQSV